MDAAVIQLIVGAVSLLILIILFGVLGWKSKFLRFIVILFVIGLCGVWIYPSFQWYFLLDEGSRNLVNIPVESDENIVVESSKFQSIKEYITEIRKSIEKMREIVDLNQKLYRHPYITSEDQEKKYPAEFDIRVKNRYNKVLEIEDYKFNISEETFRKEILPEIKVNEEKLEKIPELYALMIKWKSEYLSKQTPDVSPIDIENIKKEIVESGIKDEKSEKFKTEFMNRLRTQNTNLNTKAKEIFVEEDYKKFIDEMEKQVKEEKVKLFFKEMENAIKVRKDLLYIEELKALKLKTINLGLDLAGGISFTLDVDENALNADMYQQYNYLTDENKIKESDEMKEYIANVKNTLLEEIKSAITIDEVTQIEQQIIDEKKITDKESKEFKDEYNKLLNEATQKKLDSDEYKKIIDSRIAQRVEEKKKEGENIIRENIAYQKEQTKRDALEILKKRVNQFGVSEPEIGKTLGDRPLVQLPGADDPAAARKMVTQAGKLEFKLVNDELMNTINGRRAEENLLSYEAYPTAKILSDELKRLNPEKRDRIEYIVEADKCRIRAEDGNIENDTYAYQQSSIDKRGQRQVDGWMFIKNKLEMPGKHIVNPVVQMSQQGINEPYISFELDAEGTKIFQEVTRNNKKRRLAIILDGYVQSAPTIQDEIIGRGSISGRFTVKTAQELASVLKAGSLSSKLAIVSENVIGPKLGAENIRSGIMAILIGLAAVMLFMFIYYRLGGLFANIALITNLYLMLSILSMFHFTLTLPGMAGVLLTIGMAVDANVLIYERIKEEFRNGKTLTVAVEEGFGKAFWTIFDSNLTTLLSAIVLAQVGTGIIRGFGVTLAVGIVSSMFTALVITKLFTDVTVSLTKGKKLWIGLKK